MIGPPQFAPDGKRTGAGYNRTRLFPQVDSNRRFRALSLDLWFTALYYPPERDRQWKEDRVRLLHDTLSLQDGRILGMDAIERAMDSVHARLRDEGREPITIDPGVLIPLYASALDADLTMPLDEFARTYSSVGLAEHPPVANPEAVSVARALTERGIPVIAITNTARRGSSWQEYLRDRMDLGFQHVIASSDCGSAKPDPGIFHEAARRVGLSPREILHVGDRWELDVQGAQAAHFGAALYTGLWRYYPEGPYSPTDRERTEDSTVPRVERLEDVLGMGLLP